MPTAKSAPRSPEPTRLIRPLVRRLHPYVPGEQPAIRRLIKLNTNENPYPPPPSVLQTVRAAVDGRLRLYPNPTADGLRQRLAKLHGCGLENLIVGNGSDELLALAVRAFVEPAPGKPGGQKSARHLVQFFNPSYSLYPVLAEAHGARTNAVALADDFSLPTPAALKRGRCWDFRAALALVTTPNAPTGRAFSTSSLAELCQAQRGVVLLDEAYVDFARENAMGLALRLPNVLVARTFSKAYSLCFQRVGYCVGHPELIGALHKLRDSYNVNGLGQVAAEAALAARPAYEAIWQRVQATRTWLTGELEKLGFEVLPSATNFVLARPPGPPAAQWLTALRERRVLVRWFDRPDIRQYLRITIGAEEEMAVLIRAARAILRSC